MDRHDARQNKEETSYYDTLAPGYDRLHQEEQLAKLHLVISDLRCAKLPSGEILDVGCGTGFSLDLLHQELGRPCVGIEPSPGMRKQYQGKETLDAGRAEQLPYPDERFAATISVTAIQNFQDIGQGVAEMTRVTKRGGTLIITILKKSPRLAEAAQALADNLIVQETQEEEKDILFICRRPHQLPFQHNP